MLSRTAVTPSPVRVLDEGSRYCELFQREEVDVGERLCHRSGVVVDDEEGY